MYMLVNQEVVQGKQDMKWFDIVRTSALKESVVVFFLWVLITCGDFSYTSYRAICFSLCFIT